MKRVAWLKSEHMTQWDAFVENHPFGWISHLSDWKEVMERTFKHIRGHFVVIWDDGPNEIVAGIPIYTVKSWVTGNRIVSVPFITHGDGLISSPKHMERLFPHILELYRNTNASHIELNTWRSAPLVRIPQLHASHFYKHHYLNLDRGLEELKNNFHKSSIRRKIARAMKSRLALRLGQDEKDLLRFYDIFLQTRKRIGLPPIPYKFFRSLWEFFGDSKHMTILLVIHKGQTVASSLLLKYGQMVTAEYGCDTGEFRNLGVNQFCEWEAIKMAFYEGYKTYSFGRTSPLNKGLMASKGRWGARVDDLPRFFFPGLFAQRYAKMESSWKYRFVSRISERAPEPLFHIFGNLLYRHMG